MAAPTVYTSGVQRALSPLLGTERVFLDNGGPQGEMASVAQLAGFGTVAAQSYSVSALAASGTLLAANVTGGTDTVIVNMSGAFGGAANIQLPLASAMIAAMSTLQGVGSTYILRVLNPGTQTLTITTNTGITLTGTVTIPTLSFREFLVTIGSATAITVQNIGSAAAAAQ